MADLLDIVPETAIETVQTDGGPLTVRGLRGPAIASIVSRFPKSVVLFGGGMSVDSTAVIAQCGLAIGPIIAAGCNQLGVEKYEQAGAEMLLEDQIKVVAAIMRLTFPNGLDSFAEAMKTWQGMGEGVRPIKVRLKKSPSPSPPSSDGASLQTTL